MTDALSLDGLASKTFDLDLQTGLAALEIGNHRAVDRLLQQKLVEPVLQPLEVSDVSVVLGSVVPLHTRECAVVLVDLQFEKNIGVRTKARHESYRPRHAVEPFAASLFARAVFAAVKRVA